MLRSIRYQLGCEDKYLDGYINVAFPVENLKVNKPIKADHFENILTMEMKRCTEIKINVFNLFNFFDSYYLLYKWYFSLMPMGLLRISFLDLESLAKNLLNSSTEKTFKIIRSLYGSHESNWAYNLNGWTKQTLTYALEKTGFLVYKVEENESESKIELCSIKHGDRRRKDVIKSIHELFKLYKNGDTEFENGLEAYYIKEFDRRVEIWGKDR